MFFHDPSKKCNQGRIPYLPEPHWLHNRTTSIMRQQLYSEGITLTLWRDDTRRSCWMQLVRAESRSHPGSLFLVKHYILQQIINCAAYQFHTPPHRSTGMCVYHWLRVCGGFMRMPSVALWSWLSDVLMKHLVIMLQTIFFPHGDK